MISANKSVISAEESNRKGKTRDLFQKIRDTMWNISCKDGHNKGQKRHEPNKQKMLRRGGKNTQNYTEKVLMTQIITMMWSLF